MSETNTLNAERRAARGKSGARHVRRAGRVPGIVYGGGSEPLPITVDAAEIDLRSRHAGFLSHVFDLDIAGERQQVLPREVQHHPLSGAVVHVDFMRVSATSELSVDVEVVFENADKSPGLKGGGVLNVVMHTVGIICTPGAIPDRFAVDLSGLEIGDVVHVAALKLPPGARLDDPDTSATVASIAPPTAEAVEKPAVAEAEPPA
jgi:large subunit ribosomal protein L25